MNRRNFIKTSAFATVAAALMTAPMSVGRTALAQSPSQDLEILNFALTLEHLEARAYRDLLASGLLSGTVRQYFVTFGAHETAHVEVLTDTIRQLGGQPVAALESYNFPTLNNQNEAVEYFLQVEELGAAAYLGQAPRLQNPDLITAAVGIHNVEAQHAAVLSDVVGVSPSPAFAEPQTMAQVLQVVGPILDMGDTEMPSRMPSAMPSTGRAASVVGQEGRTASAMR